MLFSRYLILSVIFFITACSPVQPQLHEYVARFYSFGTIINVTIYDKTQAHADELFSEISQSLNQMHHRWHAWHKSQLTDIASACQDQQPVIIDDEIRLLIELGRDYYHSSQGLFNPASGDLIKLWGFFSDNPQATRPPPSNKEISAWLQHKPSMDDLVLKNQTVYCKNPRLRLDFGGFAKGYGVGLLIDLIKSHGIKQAIVNAGGDLQTIGLNSRQQPWQIAIEDPGSKNPLAVLKSTNESIFTSAKHIRQFSYKGKQYHHILNPTTGYPAADDFISVTVIDSNPSKADAAATALMIAGKNQYQTILKSMHINKWVILSQNNELLISSSLTDNLLASKAGVKLKWHEAV